MDNHTSDTETSISNGKSVEEFKKDSIYPETTTSPAQNNITNQTQIGEVSTTEVLLSPHHKNQQDENLYTNWKLIHTIITLLYDISANLKETGNTKEPLHHYHSQQLHSLTQQVQQINETTNQQKTSKPQHRNHNETLHHYLSQQLHSLSQKVEQMQQSYPQDNKPRNPTTRKHETRTCFICEKPGHIARNCRNQPSRWQKYQQNRQNTSFRNKNFKPRTSHQTPQNNGNNTSNNTNRHNWQRTILRSKPTSSQNTSILPHQHNHPSPEFQNKELNPLQDSPQNKILKTRTNNGD